MNSRNYWKCLNIEVKITLEIKSDFLFLSQKAYNQDPEGFWNNKLPLLQQLYGVSTDFTSVQINFLNTAHVLRLREKIPKKHSGGLLNTNITVV